ncbi:hypothetical protein HP532_11480 [Pseudomonas sp. CrR25]|nr:hypothetical protein [Pseudomonas sp. CrR25]
MDVVKTLKPGKSGTKRLVELYGDHLVAVRYRLDPLQQISYTNIELIIERKPAPSQSVNRTAQHLHQNRQSIAVRILRHETDRQAAGHKRRAKWQRNRQVWLLGLYQHGRSRRAARGPGQAVTLSSRCYSLP